MSRATTFFRRGMTLVYSLLSRVIFLTSWRLVKKRYAIVPAKNVTERYHWWYQFAIHNSYYVQFLRHLVNNMETAGVFHIVNYAGLIY